MSDLQTFEHESASDPDASIIWMHGLGADAHDFEPIVPQLALSSGRGVRFIFPNAPVRPITMNGGMPMRAWYDLIAAERDAPEDEAGIRASASSIEQLIARENERGIDADRIVLAGFSQGGAIALFTALRYQQRLAGVLALSTYLPLGPKVEGELAENNRDLPIFMAHGQHDVVVSFNFARNSRTRLHKLGYPIQWQEYAMEHSIVPEEIVHIREFLDQVLG